jgi:hypothetical protein
MSPFQEALEQWHEFHLMTGTAAVTLVGLLFVVLSLHLEVLFQDQHRDFRQLAIEAFQGYLYILFLSLILLAPAPGPRVLGFGTLAIHGAMLVRSTTRLIGHLRARSRLGVKRGLPVRLIVPVLAYALGGTLGYSMMSGEFPPGGFLGPILLMLGTSTRASWDLLENVARVRREGFLVEDRKVE